MKKWVGTGVLLFLMISGCSTGNENNTENGTSAEDTSTSKWEAINLHEDDFFKEEIEMKIAHVHGLGYMGNQDIITFATHYGLVLLEDGQWFKTAEELNDYMGFSAVADGFYSSGHPGEKSSYEGMNPLGVVKSVDGGKTVHSLDLLEEIDFHVKGTGYYNNAIYGYNPYPNSRMSDTGLHYSLDDTETWTQSEMNNLPEPTYDAGNHPNYFIAAHPRNENEVAVGTAEGLFISDNYGDDFAETDIKVPVISISYYEDDLYLSVWTGKSELLRLTDDGGVESLPIPEMVSQQDVIQYIAVNPNDSEEIVYITFIGNAYISNDEGETWEQIIEDHNTVTNDSDET